MTPQTVEHLKTVGISDHPKSKWKGYKVEVNYVSNLTLKNKNHYRFY